MELDELKSLWQSTDNRMTHVESSMAQVQLRQTSANRLYWEPIFEIIMAGLTLLWAGNFLATNWQSVLQRPLLAIPVGIFYPLSIYVIRIAVIQIILAGKVGYGNSVTESQRAISIIRRLNIRSTKFLLLVGIPLWFMPILALFQSLAGYNSIASLSLVAMTVNVVIGAVFSVTMIVLSKKIGHRSKFSGAIDEIFSGDAVNRVERELSDIQVFASNP
jgi:hypothetical protein